MQLDLSGPMIASYKAQAKTLRTSKPKGESLTHAQALERIAKNEGMRDWNTLRAKASKPVTVTPGMRVQGRYLGQFFEGQIYAVSMLGSADQMRVTVQFDEPVDVVRFDSFSAFRSRITSVIGKNGASKQMTSDGEPHLVLTGAYS